MKGTGTLKQIANANYQIEVGNLDRKSNQSQFIVIAGWAKLKDPETPNIQGAINKLDKRIRQAMHALTTAHPVLENRFIVDYDTAERGYTRNLMTYFQVEVTIFSQPLPDKTYKELTMAVNQEVIDMVILILENNETFTFQRDKPRKSA